MALINNKKKDLEEKLGELKHEEEEKRAKDLAEKTDFPYVNLALIPIDPNDLIIIPQTKAQQGNLVIARKLGRVLQIAVQDPQNPKTKEIIRELQNQGYQCKIFITSLSNLKKAWRQYQAALYPSKEVSLRGIFNIDQKELAQFKKSLVTVQELSKKISNLSTTQLLTIVLAGAIEMKASDVHLEPSKENIRLRYRIDGLLQDIAAFPVKEYDFLLSRIKTLADLLLNVHDTSQDGRFSIKILNPDSTAKGEQIIDIRVSVLPSKAGESIVMRLLGMAAVKLELKELGIRPESLKIIQSQLSQPNGMLLATGPTGSGKTTTLYACLNHVNKPGTKIITVEDPIEYQLDGITQTQISQRKGQTFAKSLTSIVRQDPDILMIGEIRDQESAETAIQFALTGHLVFSTIHANQAAGAIPRLLNMNVSPESLGSSINLLMAQRLVRKLCPDCKKPHQPDKETIKTIKKMVSSIPTNKFYQAQGCAKCYGLGYRGRIGVFEFLPVSQAIRKLILNKAAAFEIQKQAQSEGMVIMLQDASLKAIQGITSLEEVERVFGAIQLAAQETDSNTH
ncbi:MAG: GspE/PulE family protein [Patescibacteria group bacterium]